MNPGEQHIENFTWDYQQGLDYPLARLEQMMVVVLQCANWLETVTEQKTGRIIFGSETVKEHLRKQQTAYQLFVDQKLPPNTVKIVMQNLKYGVLEVINFPAKLADRRSEVYA